MVSQAYHYDSISDLIKRYQTEKLEKVNFYGVITYLGPPKPKVYQLTVVDESCQAAEKLKCNIFINADDAHSVLSSCEIGDIIRCHRFKIDSFKNNPQGVCFPYSSWVRFKRNSNTFEYKGNKKNDTFEEQDKKAVTSLREWLKTNPQLHALFEANLSTQARQDEVNESMLNLAASAMHMNLFNDKLKLDSLNLVKFDKIQPKTYSDFICQVCAVCYTGNELSVSSHKALKFLIVWDGTKTNYAVYQEQEFKFDNKPTTSKAVNEIKAYFSKSIVEQAYQVFIFDEHAEKIDSIQPGDYILLRNANICKPTSLNADLIMKMPGGGSTYNRTILKLASHDLNFTITNNETITSEVKQIHEKGKQFDLKFVSEDEFRASFQLNLQDETLIEMLNHKTSEENARQKPMSKVDMLLNDDSNMYITEDEDSKGEENKVTEDNNQIKNATKSTNQPADEQIKDVHIYRQSLTTTISPIKNLIPNTLELAETINASDEDLVTNQTVSTSTQKVQLVKKAKIIDPYEICKEIFKIKRLVVSTYIVPYLTCDLDFLSTQDSIPFFVSLEKLANHAQNNNFIRCKVSAKIFSYSLNSCPQITSVFVNCKKCNYINFTPFNLGTTHQRPIVSAILTDLQNAKENLQPMNEDDNSQDFNTISCTNSANFSLNWIHTALPNELQMPAETQSSQVEVDLTDIPIMYYHCPRCLLVMESTKENSMNEDSDEASLLEYIFRFWFKLKDASSILDPCLIEGELVEKFLGTTPIKFYTNKNKAHQVYSKIIENFDKKYIFTIDTFKLPEQMYNPRKLKILYKIVDILEVKAL